MSAFGSGRDPWVLLLLLPLLAAPPAYAHALCQINKILKKKIISNLHVKSNSHFFVFILLMQWVILLILKHFLHLVLGHHSSMFFSHWLAAPSQSFAGFSFS